MLWDTQTQASLSFFFRYENAGSTDVWSDAISRLADKSMNLTIQPGGVGTVVMRFRLSDGGGNEANAYVTFNQGASYHVAMTHAPGAQTVWVNGIPTVFNTLSFATQTWNVPFILGSTPYGSPCIYTLSDVATWNGKVLDSTDVGNLRDGLWTPSQTSAGTPTAEWTLAGTIGDTPQVGDAGLIEHGGNTSYDLVTIAGAGSAVYSAPLTFEPAAGVRTAYVGTSGKTIVFFFETVPGLASTLPIQLNTAPTISKNGTSLGDLINPWITGYHNCAMFGLPAGTSIVAGDSVTLSAPTGWMSTAAGITQSLSDTSISNKTGLSVFGTESLVKTLRVGLNFSHLGTSSWALYQVPKNWRYRLGLFYACSHTPDGKPITWSPNSQWASVDANLYNTDALSNRLDSTNFPCPVGLYAVCWDDLNTSVPTTFFISTDQPATTTITERTDLANPGVNGVGEVRVFDVQQASGSTVASLSLKLSVQNADQTPEFDNLFIYGPGDFNYQNDTPVVLDRSDPYTLSSVILNRLNNGMGSARWLDSTIDYGGWSDMSEPEELRRISDFSWGESNIKQGWTIRYTSARPYSTSTSPYIYSTFVGSPFSATLAQDITTTPTAGTQETYTGYFTDAIAAPILAGLTLTIGSEIMRVISVSGTDPDATVVVARGAESTIPASHSAGSIQVNNRLTVTGLSMFGSPSTLQVVEHVTQSPHGLKTGQLPILGGTWPTLTFTDSSTMSVAGLRRAISVTGANTFVTIYGAATSGPVTLDGTTTLDPAQTYTYWSPVSIGFPYEFIALTTGKFADCDLQVNLPFLASNTMVDTVASLVRDNFPAGRKVWIELSDEPWNYFFQQWQTFGLMTNLAYPGEDFYAWNVVRTAEICQRFRDRFDENGSRSGEIKSLINIQNGSDPTTIFTIAVNNSVAIDGIAVAPYVNPDTSSDSVAAYDAFDDEQAIDLWIHDLWYNTVGYASAAATTRNAIETYNTNNSKSCVLYGYEGGLSETTSGSYVLQRSRDMPYNPNWRPIEHDMYAFFQSQEFNRINLYAYDMTFVANQNWGLYHSIAQPYGRGDGSDGKADNRLCLATPGKPNTKDSSTNQEQQNVSVRGLAFLDWMEGTLPKKKPRSRLRQIAGAR